MSTGKRLRTTFKERELLLQRYDRFPPMSQRAAARLLNISPSLLCVWLRRRKLTKATTVTAPNKTELVEAALWGWMDSSRGKGIIPPEVTIRSKAHELSKTMDFPDFRADKAWFGRFLNRERIIRKRFKLDWHEDDDHNNSPPEQPRCARVPNTSDRSSEKKRNASKRTEFENVRVYKVAERSENDSESDYMDALRQSDDTSVEGEREELDIPKLDPSLVTAELDGTSHTVVVPSLWQMKEAMKTLATGLLYRGFCDFKLLHQFEKEVDNVLRRSLSLRTQRSFQD